MGIEGIESSTGSRGSRSTEGIEGSMGLRGPRGIEGSMGAEGIEGIPWEVCLFVQRRHYTWSVSRPYYYGKAKSPSEQQKEATIAEQVSWKWVAANPCAPQNLSAKPQKAKQPRNHRHIKVYASAWDRVPFGFTWVLSGFLLSFRSRPRASFLCSW